MQIFIDLRGELASGLISQNWLHRIEIRVTGDGMGRFQVDFRVVK